MKGIILFILALSLIGSSAFAQGLPSTGPSVSGQNPATTSARGRFSKDLTSAYGASSGAYTPQDPYGTAAAASHFGTPSGMANPQDPSGQNNPYPYGVMPR